MNSRSVRILNNTFNRNVYNRAAHHPFQTWEFGESQTELGHSVVRFGFFNEEEVIQVYQIIIHSLGTSGLYIGHLIRGKLPPIFVLRAIKEWAKKNGVIFIHIEPYEDESKQIPLYSSLIPSKQSLTFDYTIQIPLLQSESELVLSLKPKTRYNIRLAERKGIQIREESTLKGLEIFLSLFLKNCKRKGFYGKNKAYHESVFKHLCKNIAHIFIAYHQTIPVAAYQIYIHDKIAHFPFGATNIAYKQFMGSNLLMWEVLKFSRKTGCTYFDMSETLGPSHSLNHPWSGLTRFAEGYGGEYKKLMRNLDLVIDKKNYSDYRSLESNIGKIVGLLFKK